MDPVTKAGANCLGQMVLIGLTGGAIGTVAGTGVKMIIHSRRSARENNDLAPCDFSGPIHARPRTLCKR